MTKRLFISADIEGTTGVVSMEQLTPAGFEYQQARQWMTNEVNAACEAALEQGIDEIVIADSHGNGQNLLIDQLPAQAQVVRSWPRPHCMMEGIQHGDYIGAFLLGYHSGASNRDGVLAHTLHGGGITEVRLNGQVASETVISAATAAHYNVPVILVSGDDAYVAHAREVLNHSECEIQAVVTKQAISATSALMKPPETVYREIREATTKAIATADRMRANPLQGPIEVEVDCLLRRAAEIIDYLPNTERTSARTVNYICRDMVEASRYLQFLLSSGALTPK